MFKCSCFLVCVTQVSHSTLTDLQITTFDKNVLTIMSLSIYSHVKNHCHTVMSNLPENIIKAMLEHKPLITTVKHDQR